MAELNEERWSTELNVYEEMETADHHTMTSKFAREAEDEADRRQESAPRRRKKKNQLKKKKKSRLLVHVVEKVVKRKVV